MALPQYKMLAGKGIRITVVMWVMTMISFIPIPLRLYTRAYVLEMVGLDDHIYNLAWGFLLLYATFVTISGMHGLGQPMASLSLDEAANAVYMEMIGQTFAVLGMAIAKLSLCLFLLRIVVKKWHRLSIWAAMISLSIISMVTAVVLWIQRVPSKSIYDARVTGHSIVSVTPFSILLGVWCSLVDFYLAILPWLFIWNLNMEFKKKVTIAASLSLGFIAGICGIIRTIELGGLSSANYTEDTVNLIIWSAVELAVTLFCVGLPTLAPLYRRRGFHRSGFQRSGSSHYDERRASSEVRLRDLDGQAEQSTTVFTGDKYGISPVNSEQYFNNHGDEETARTSFQVDQNGRMYGNNGIRVKKEVLVKRT